jgi:hypothetical protein
MNRWKNIFGEGVGDGGRRGRMSGNVVLNGSFLIYHNIQSSHFIINPICPVLGIPGCMQIIIN